MIEIEVLNSPCSERTGIFLFNKNLIYIGKNMQSDLVLEDDELQNNHLFIEVVENRLLVHPHKDIPFYLVNGKRTTSFKYLKHGDKLGIGNCLLQIKNFLKEDFLSKKEFLNNRVSEVQEKEPLVLELIGRLNQ